MIDKEECEHPNAYCIDSYAVITVVYIMTCPECGHEWVESGEY
jgi:hypothetical protein